MGNLSTKAQHVNRFERQITCCLELKNPRVAVRPWGECIGSLHFPSLHKVQVLQITIPSWCYTYSTISAKSGLLTVPQWTSHDFPLHGLSLFWIWQCHHHSCCACISCLARLTLFAICVFLSQLNLFRVGVVACTRVDTWKQISENHERRVFK